jgi:hypothetical protein
MRQAPGLSVIEAGHAAGDQGKQNQTHKNAAQELGIGLYCVTHPETPVKLRQKNQSAIHPNRATVK